MPVSDARCPAGISSFFEVCSTDSTGKSLSDPAWIGARGGGFGITKGVRAHVSARKASRNKITIRINSKNAPEAHTTRFAIDRLLKDAERTLDVQVDLKVNVPMAAGYGTSAAGTLATCLALADAAEIPMTMNQLGRIAHVAEVENRTGLGTVSALLLGGFVLVTEPGAPGIGLVDRLHFPGAHSVLCAYLGPIDTRKALSQSDIAVRVNPAAQRVMEAVRRKPDLVTFLDETRKFSSESGFQTAEIARLMDLMISAGAVGAAQNMIGRAVHCVAEDSRIPQILKAVRKEFPSASLFHSDLDVRGVRLV